MFLPEFREMVRALMVKPDGRVIPLEVATLGLVGEVGECMHVAGIVDHEALLELGDAAWYACAITELVPGATVFFGPDFECGDPFQDACSLAEHVKKAWHDKPIQVGTVEVLLTRILMACCHEVDDLTDNDAVLETAQRLVMAKLAKRWPNGFGVSK